MKLPKFGKSSKYFYFHCKIVGFSKFCIVGTFAWGLNTWFHGISRHHLTWEKIQKVSIGLLVLDYHFSL